MCKIGYILNFSESYDADNYLYFFQPAIASNRIMLFEEITKKQLTTNSDTKEKDIEERIKLIKRNWEYYKLNITNATCKPVINIILESDLWEFTKFGKFSRFPFVKMYVINEKIKKIFLEYEINQIRLQYFFITHKNNKIDNIIKTFDLKKGFIESPSNVKFGDIDVENFNWAYYSDFKNIVEKKIDINTNINEDIIPDDYKKEELGVQEIKEILRKKYIYENDLEKFQRFLNNRLEELEKKFYSEIKTYNDINDVEKKKEIIKNFFKTFSSYAYLKKGKDFMFHFQVLEDYNTNIIESYEKLTLLLIEFINFFDQPAPGKFLSNQDENIKIFEIEDIEIDEKHFEEKYLTKYVSFSKDKKQIDDEFKENIKVKIYSYNENHSREDDFKINDKKLLLFTSVNNIQKKIKFFYPSEKKIETIKNDLRNNSLDNIEEEIEIKRDKVSFIYKIDDDDDSISSEIKTPSIKEIENEIKKLKEELKKSKVISKINYDKYKLDKKKYIDTIKIKNKEFINELSKLPTLKSLSFFLMFSSILISLFLSPLYDFTYKGQAFLYFVLFLVSSIFIIFILAFFNKITIKNKLSEIKLENEKLKDSFIKYVNSLKELSQNIRKNAFARKNLFNLEKEKNRYYDEINKRNEYVKFYQNLIGKIKSNNIYQIPEYRSAFTEPNYDVPPINDKRTIVNNGKVKIKIKCDDSEDNKKVNSELAIIKTIKTKTKAI